MSKLGINTSKGFHEKKTNEVAINSDGVTATITEMGLYICQLEYGGYEYTSLVFVDSLFSTIFGTKTEAYAEESVTVFAKCTNGTITACSSTGYEDTGLNKVVRVDLWL